MDNSNKKTNTQNSIPEPTPERARMYAAQNIKPYSNDENYVGNALERLGKILRMLRSDRGWKNSDMLEHLDVEHFARPEQFARLIENKWSKRPPTAGQMFELRRVFGISLDAVADGENPFMVEQMSDARLVEMMEQISAELARRIRQR